MKKYNLSPKDAKAADMALKIAASYTKKEGYTLDPMTILMIAGLIINLAKIAYECYKDKNKAVNAMQNPGLIAKIILAREIRKACKTGVVKHSTLKEAFLKEKFTTEDLMSLF